jgi:hypothetical protein
MGTDDRDHYDRPSWKEIDQKKDGRSENTEKSTSPKLMHRNKVAKKEYLKKLDNMFSGDKGSAEHYELMQLLKTYQSGKKFSDNIVKYVDLYGLPENFEVLSAMIELNDSEMVTQAVNRLLEHFEEIPKNLRDLISMKASLLKLTHSNKDIVALLEKIPDIDS